jgi:hypothetical protein
VPEIVTVTGKGAISGSKIIVAVRTTQIFPQDCTLDISSNGEWSCAGVYFLGKGRFADQHELAVKMIAPDGRTLQLREFPIRRKQ